MIITELGVNGAFLIEPERLADERGFFARTWCQREVAAYGLPREFVQSSVSYNRAAGTLRGMHYQTAPHEEAKLIQVQRGAIYDVVLDLRRGSPSYLKWTAIELTADNLHLLFIPEGCAHGFQTLQPDSVVSYQISQYYEPASARGVRWNDRAFGIAWPLAAPIMSSRDQQFPDYQP